MDDKEYNSLLRADGEEYENTLKLSYTTDELTEGINSTFRIYQTPLLKGRQVIKADDGSDLSSMINVMSREGIASKISIIRNNADLNSKMNLGIVQLNRLLVSMDIDNYGDVADVSSKLVIDPNSRLSSKADLFRTPDLMSKFRLLNPDYLQSKMGIAWPHALDSKMDVPYHNHMHLEYTLIQIPETIVASDVIKDSYTSQANPAQNYGDLNSVLINSFSDTVRAYFQLDVSNLRNYLTNPNMKINSIEFILMTPTGSLGSNINVNLYEFNTTWGEYSITWNNQGDYGAFVKSGVFKNGQTYHLIDIKEYIIDQVVNQNAQYVSFYVESDRELVVYSRESNYPPYIRLVCQDQTWDGFLGEFDVQSHMRIQHSLETDLPSKTDIIYVAELQSKLEIVRILEGIDSKVLIETSYKDGYRDLSSRLTIELLKDLLQSKYLVPYVDTSDLNSHVFIEQLTDGILSKLEILTRKDAESDLASRIGIPWNGFYNLSSKAVFEMPSIHEDFNSKMTIPDQYHKDLISKLEITGLYSDLRSRLGIAELIFSDLRSRAEITAITGSSDLNSLVKLIANRVYDLESKVGIEALKSALDSTAVFSLGQGREVDSKVQIIGQGSDGLNSRMEIYNKIDLLSRFSTVQIEDSDLRSRFFTLTDSPDDLLSKTIIKQRGISDIISKYLINTTYGLLELDTTPPQDVVVRIKGQSDLSTPNLRNILNVTSSSTDTYEIKIWGDLDLDYDPRIQDTEANSQWITYSNEVDVKFPLAGSKTKIVYVRLRDDVYNETDAIRSDITLKVYDLTVTDGGVSNEFVQFIELLVMSDSAKIREFVSERQFLLIEYPELCDLILLAQENFNGRDIEVVGEYVNPNAGLGYGYPMYPGDEDFPLGTQYQYIHPDSNVVRETTRYEDASEVIITYYVDFYKEINLHVNEVINKKLTLRFTPGGGLGKIYVSTLASLGSGSSNPTITTFFHYDGRTIDGATGFRNIFDHDYNNGAATYYEIVITSSTSDYVDYKIDISCDDFIYYKYPESRVTNELYTRKVDDVIWWNNFNINDDLCLSANLRLWAKTDCASLDSINWSDDPYSRIMEHYLEEGLIEKEVYLPISGDCSAILDDSTPMQIELNSSDFGIISEKISDTDRTYRDSGSHCDFLLIASMELMEREIEAVGDWRTNLYGLPMYPTDPDYPSHTQGIIFPALIPTDNRYSSYHDFSSNTTLSLNVSTYSETNFNNRTSSKLYQTGLATGKLKFDLVISNDTTGPSSFLEVEYPGGIWRSVDIPLGESITESFEIDYDQTYENDGNPTAFIEFKNLSYYGYDFTFHSGINVIATIRSTDFKLEIYHEDDVNNPNYTRNQNDFVDFIVKDVVCSANPAWVNLYGSSSCAMLSQQGEFEITDNPYYNIFRYFTQNKDKYNDDMRFWFSNDCSIWIEYSYINLILNQLITGDDRLVEFERDFSEDPIDACDGLLLVKEDLHEREIVPVAEDILEFNQRYGNPMYPNDPDYYEYSYSLSSTQTIYNNYLVRDFVAGNFESITWFNSKVIYPIPEDCSYNSSKIIDFRLLSNGSLFGRYSALTFFVGREGLYISNLPIFPCKVRFRIQMRCRYAYNYEVRINNQITQLGSGVGSSTSYSYTDYIEYEYTGDYTSFDTFYFSMYNEYPSASNPGPAMTYEAYISDLTFDGNQQIPQGVRLKVPSPDNYNRDEYNVIGFKDYDILDQVCEIEPSTIDIYMSSSCTNLIDYEFSVQDPILQNYIKIFNHFTDKYGLRSRLNQYEINSKFNGDCSIWIEYSYISMTLYEFGITDEFVSMLERVFRDSGTFCPDLLLVKPDYKDRDIVPRGDIVPAPGLGYGYNIYPEDFDYLRGETGVTTPIIYGYEYIDMYKYTAAKGITIPYSRSGSTKRFCLGIGKGRLNMYFISGSTDSHTIQVYFPDEVSARIVRFTGLGSSSFSYDYDNSTNLQGLVTIYVSSVSTWDDPLDIRLSRTGTFVPYQINPENFNNPDYRRIPYYLFDHYINDTYCGDEIANLEIYGSSECGHVSDVEWHDFDTNPFVRMFVYMSWKQEYYQKTVRFNFLTECLVAIDHLDLELWLSDYGFSLETLIEFDRTHQEIAAGCEALFVYFTEYRGRDIEAVGDTAQVRNPLYGYTMRYGDEDYPIDPEDPSDHPPIYTFNLPNGYSMVDLVDKSSYEFSIRTSQTLKLVYGYTAGAIRYDWSGRDFYLKVYANYELIRDSHDIEVIGFYNSSYSFTDSSSNPYSMARIDIEIELLNENAYCDLKISSSNMVDTQALVAYNSSYSRNYWIYGGNVDFLIKDNQCTEEPAFVNMYGSSSCLPLYKYDWSPEFFRNPYLRNFVSKLFNNQLYENRQIWWFDTHCDSLSEESVANIELPVRGDIVGIEKQYSYRELFFFEKGFDCDALYIYDKDMKYREITTVYRTKRYVYYGPIPPVGLVNDPYFRWGLPIMPGEPDYPLLPSGEPNGDQPIQPRLFNHSGAAAPEETKLNFMVEYFYYPNEERDEHGNHASHWYYVGQVDAGSRLTMHLKITNPAVPWRLYLQDSTGIIFINNYEIHEEDELYIDIPYSGSFQSRFYVTFTGETSYRYRVFGNRLIYSYVAPRWITNAAYPNQYITNQLYLNNRPGSYSYQFTDYQIGDNLCIDYPSPYAATYISTSCHPLAGYKWGAALRSPDIARILMETNQRGTIGNNKFSHYLKYWFSTACHFNMFKESAIIGLLLRDYGKIVDSLVNLEKDPKRELFVQDLGILTDNFVAINLFGSDNFRLIFNDMVHQIELILRDNPSGYLEYVHILNNNIYNFSENSVVIEKVNTIAMNVREIASLLFDLVRDIMIVTSGERLISLEGNAELERDLFRELMLIDYGALKNELARIEIPVSDLFQIILKESAIIDLFGTDSGVINEHGPNYNLDLFIYGIEVLIFKERVVKIEQFLKDEVKLQIENAKIWIYPADIGVGYDVYMDDFKDFGRAFESAIIELFGRDESILEERIVIDLHLYDEGVLKDRSKYGNWLIHVVPREPGFQFNEGEYIVQLVDDPEFQLENVEINVTIHKDPFDMQESTVNVVLGEDMYKIAELEIPYEFVESEAHFGFKGVGGLSIKALGDPLNSKEISEEEDLDGRADDSK